MRDRLIVLAGILLLLAGCDERDPGPWVFRDYGAATIIFRNGQSTTCERVQSIGRAFGIRYRCIQHDGVMDFYSSDVGSVKHRGNPVTYERGEKRAVDWRTPGWRA